MLAATTVANMTIRELVSALKVGTDRANVNRLVYQIDTRVTSEKIKVVEFLNNSTQELERARQLVKLVDDMATQSHIDKDVTQHGDALDALASYSYYFTKVALATAWLEYLRAISEQVNYLQTISSLDRSQAIMALVDIAKRSPEITFNSGAPLQATSPFKRVERELQKLQNHYGLQSLYAYEAPRGLYSTALRATETLQGIWTGSPSFYFRPTMEGGDLQAVISLT